MKSDDTPIQSCGAYVPEDDVVEVDDTGVPLERRLQSKVWKTRTVALEELSKLLSSREAPFEAYLDQLPQFLSDPNQGVLLKAFEVLQIYVLSIPSLLESLGQPLIKLIIEKGVSSAKLKQIALECLLGLFAEVPSTVIAGLTESLGSKNAKVQLAAIVSVNSIANQYGHGSLSKMRPSIEKSSQSSNASIRNEALSFMNSASSEDFNMPWVERVLSYDKWAQKKQALEEVNSKICKKVNDDTLSALSLLARELISDTNVQVYTLCIKLIGNLACYNPEFEAKSFFSVLVQKFKDKKAFVIQEVQSALEKCLRSLPLDGIFEDIRKGLEDKVPAVKINLCIWLKNALLQNPINDKNTTKLINILKKNSDDSDAEIRNSAFSVLGILLYSKPSIVRPAINDLPKIKVKKIEQSMPEMPEMPDEETKVPRNEKPSGREKAREEPEIIVEELSEENFLNLIPPSIVKNLKGAWKEKVTGLTSLREWALSHREVSLQNTDNYIKLIRETTKDWKENNTSVNKSAFEAISAIAQDFGCLKRSVPLIITQESLEKLTEAKLISPIATCLQVLSETVGPRMTVAQVLKNTGNKPKTICEICSILMKIVSDYGANSIPLQELVTFAKACLNQSNQTVKKSGLSLISLLHTQLGQSLMPLISDVSPAILKKLREEQKEPPEEFKQARGEPPQLVPSKTDISGAISLKGINDESWATRKECLENIEAVLSKTSSKVPSSGLEPLFRSLAERLRDTNKIIVKLSLVVLRKLIEKIGINCNMFSETILGPLIYCAGEEQDSIRQEALAALDKWMLEARADAILDHMGKSLEQENPELRTELINWIYRHRQSISDNNVESVLSGILVCLEDTSEFIRSSAKQVLLGIYSDYKLKQEMLSSIVFMIFEWSSGSLKDENSRESTLDLLNTLIDDLSESSSTTPEVSVLIPALCRLTEDKAWSITHKISYIYPPRHLFIYLLNNYTNPLCLEEMSALLVDYGPSLISPRDVRRISKLLTDPVLFQPALKILTEVHNFAGKSIWTLVGEESGEILKKYIKTEKEIEEEDYSELFEHLDYLKEGEFSDVQTSLEIINDYLVHRINAEAKEFGHISNRLAAGLSNLLLAALDSEDISSEFIDFLLDRFTLVVNHKEIMELLNKRTLYRFIERLYLILARDTDKFGVAKPINEAVFQVLKYCKTGPLILSLLKLLNKYDCNFIFKCLSKLSTVVRSVASDLDIEQILIYVNRYLNNSQEQKQDNVNVLKDIVFSVVKALGEFIWEAYDCIRDDDEHVKEWICEALEVPPVNKENHSESVKAFVNEMKVLRENYDREEASMQQIQAKFDELLKKTKDLKIY